MAGSLSAGHTQARPYYFSFQIQLIDSLLFIHHPSFIIHHLNKCRIITIANIKKTNGGKKALIAG